MKKKHFLYLRTLKKVDFSVFCVDASQKTYYDKEFGQTVPYSSGQQVKRSIVETVLDVIDSEKCPTVFNVGLYNKKIDKKIDQGMVIQPCDPTYIDQLIGGWLFVPKKDKKPKSKKTEEVDDESETKNDTNVDGITYSRRSPLSISAMTPLHPNLVNLIKENVVTFDRVDCDSQTLVVRDDAGNIMNQDEIDKFLNDNNINLTKRKFVGAAKRANGLFKADVAIDMRRLFRIPLRLNDREINDDVQNKLIDLGWVEVDTKQGKCLELPKKFHDEYAEAIAEGLVGWKITSNQARTFDNMTTLAIAISDRSDEVVAAIRGDLVDNDTATLVIDDNYPNTKVFSSNTLKGHVLDVECSYTAMTDAVAEIKNRILEYYN